MKALAICPRCKEVVTTDDPYIVDQEESFHQCRKGEMRWVKVKWQFYPDDFDMKQMKTKK